MNKRKYVRRVSLIAAAAMALSMGPSLAAGTPAPKWKPSGPITLIVPYGPGGSTDIIGRLLADHMKKTLGVPVVVVDVPGGNGAVGLQQVYNAKPDGLTIAIASGSIQTIIPHITKIGFDPFKMVFIASTHESVAARFVSGKSPWKTIAELVAYGKNPKNTLIDVTSGGYGLPDLGTALLSKAVGGLHYRPLATTGGSESVLRLLSGDADMGQNSASTTVQYVKSGDLRPLLIESPTWPLLESMGIPTSKKLYGYSITNPSSILAPPKTSNVIRQVLENAVKAALADKTTFDNMAKTQELVRFLTGMQAKQYARAAYNTYSPILAKVARVIKK